MDERWWCAAPRQDIHQGDGIEQSLWAEERALYISLHRFENGYFFPCSRIPGLGGAPTDVGDPGSPAEGRTVNVCWASQPSDRPGSSRGMSDGAYEEAMRSVARGSVSSSAVSVSL